MHRIVTTISTRRPFHLMCCVIGLYFAASTRSAHAEAIHFNTDTGVMTIDGNTATSFFGVPVQTSVVGGVQQFRFPGGVTFFPSYIVSASGSRPLSLWGGNDILIQPGALFSFDASGTTGKLGGGNGASGGNGGSLGSGDAGGTGGNGDAGGSGGVIYDCITFGGTDGCFVVRTEYGHRMLCTRVGFLVPASISRAEFC
jgi:hypothetical protein